MSGAAAKIDAPAAAMNALRPIISAFKADVWGPFVAGAKAAADERKAREAMEESFIFVSEVQK
jgi:hypothetical protein